MAKLAAVAVPVAYAAAVGATVKNRPAKVVFAAYSFPIPSQMIGNYIE